MFAFFLLSSLAGMPQVVIQGSVRDSKTKEPLPFCSIASKSSHLGTITNADGVFRIELRSPADTLVFSYLGYITTAVPSAKLVLSKTVFLERKAVQLKEVTVHAKDDFLYDLVDNCRKKLLKDKQPHTSKVYYGLETQARNRPVELLECYYNGYFDGPSVSHLVLKNGRIGLGELDQRLFLTLNSSKAISGMSLLIRDDHCPAIPFQFPKCELKKQFRLEMGDYDDKVYDIKFRSRDDPHQGFSGEAWIDRETFSLIRIDLKVENTPKHPFFPIFPCDTLSQVSLDISHTFRQEGDVMLPDHISFNYSLLYKSVRDTPTVKIRSIITREISSGGLLYFYDYGRPFILPYFEYDNDYDDYRKISIIPYNDLFWQNNNTLLLTEQQKKDLGFLAHEGYLVNFREGNYGKNFLITGKDDSTISKFYSTFYEFYYTFWSRDNRIILDRSLKQNNPYKTEIPFHGIASDLFNLKVQILLDVTEVKDSLSCRSYTVFDMKKTFYHLPDMPLTSAFLNIYFDICEIERQKMEKELGTNNHSLVQIDSIYKKTITGMDEVTRRYLREVQAGKNKEAMVAWNRYVITNLGIDNLSLQ